MPLRRFAPGVLVTSLLLVTCLATGATPESAAPTVKKLHPVLQQRLATADGPVKTWVFFTDKGLASQSDLTSALQRVAAEYNPRATQRRALRGDNAQRGGALFDEHDLPIVATYVDAVTATGAQLHVASRWLNAVSVWATADQAKAIAALPCVDRLEAVRQSKRVDAFNVTEVPAQPAGTSGGTRSIDYGNATAQLNQINLIALHNAGYTGQGVIIGILDSGFIRTHEAFNQSGHVVNVLAEWDFVNNDGNAGQQTGDPYDQADHGTMILGCIGAYKPGSLVGGAYNASFVLCKTEDTSQEVPAEEDNFVAGLEFIEQHGADMSTASLGYIDWYTQAQLDGQTAVTTIACNISTANGVHHTNAAGNEDNDTNPATAHLIAPADAFQVITCGAVNSTGAIAYFSSDGPTADDRVKPELLARGISTHTVSPSSNTSYTTADGTSLSTPLVASALACLIQARPYWTVDQMRQHLFEKADYFVAHGTFDPLYVRGYGILNALATYNVCSDAGVVTLSRTRYACTDTVQVEVNDCGLNASPGAIDTVQVTVSSTSDPAGVVITLTEGAPDAAEFLGTLAIGPTPGPATLLVAAGDTVTVTYVDTDNGAGQAGVVVTTTALVDCTPPIIGAVYADHILPRSATIAFSSNEPARGVVHYGLSCGALNQTATGVLSAVPTVELTGLIDGATYYYTLTAFDEAGNSVTDPTCRSFTTPDVPNYFTQLFTTDNDLDYLSLQFTPNGTVDFYRACAETITALPTDPTGGTALTLSDDSAAAVTLTGGATVSLYGTNYASFYVCSNGYTTFGTSETAYTESLATHFGLPRISALFDDLDPAQGGQVSWKQLADRVAVTWLNVAEHNVTGSQNTLQIELYFDGRITLSYLNLSATDGLAGLSRGTGQDPDFLMADLSALGPCQFYPPAAYNVGTAAGSGQAKTLALNADDDGMPMPPGALTYVIASLPMNGLLKDPVTGAVIATVPYVLANDGKLVTYQSDTYFVGTDTFTYQADDGGEAPDGGLSNTATVSVLVSAVSHVVYGWPMDVDPGWTCEGLWQFGAPTGAGTHGGDPTTAHSGANVYGYNLAGDYSSNIATPLYLTTTAIDCRQVAATELRFWKWLGIQNLDRAGVQVSADGTNWTTLWDSNTTQIPTVWTQGVYDISAVADGQATVYVRWGMGPTDASITYPGWSLDDVEIWGLAAPAPCAGDANCDGVVNWRDIDYLIKGMNDSSMAWRLSFQPNLPGCNFANLDTSGDGHVNWRDIDPFIARMNTTCP